MQIIDIRTSTSITNNITVNLISNNANPRINITISAPILSLSGNNNQAHIIDMLLHGSWSH